MNQNQTKKQKTPQQQQKTKQKKKNSKNPQNPKQAEKQTPKEPTNENQLFLFPCINHLSRFKVYQHTKIEIIFIIKSDGERKKDKFFLCINVWSASSRLNIYSHWHLFP